MTLYQRLCGMNYPAVITVLWSAGAFLVLIGIYALLWGTITTGLAMVVVGAVVIAVPFVLNPWSDSP